MAVVGLACAHSGPQKFVEGKPITDLTRLSFFLLNLYASGIAILMFFFTLFHLWLASKNMSTNERLRGVYRKSHNPWDEGFFNNMITFWSDYPSTPSNIFDRQHELVNDEEHFYYSILRRYGKLMYSTEDDADVKEYETNGPVNMFNLDNKIIDDNDSRV